jgi:NAD(P)-dependent dehydrogenase (short-subunit alcohol dehydrogenase family)
MSENKLALVTGVSSGISREIARRLAENGARVFETVRDIHSAAYIKGVELVRIATRDELRAAAQVVLRALDNRFPHLRYSVRQSGTLSRLRRYVPARLFDLTLRKRFQLDEPHSEVI